MMDPSVDQVAILGLACGALLVRVGLAWSTVGLARAKFAASTTVRSIADIAIASLAFWAVGSAMRMAWPVTPSFSNWLAF